MDGGVEVWRRLCRRVSSTLSVLEGVFGTSAVDEVEAGRIVRAENAQRSL